MPSRPSPRDAGLGCNLFVLQSFQYASLPWISSSSMLECATAFFHILRKCAKF